MSETRRQIEEAGRDHGVAAASWYFDGNTTEETYRRVLKGIEEGDPEILDSFPAGPLSGEWADDPTPTTLQRDFGLTDSEIDWACDVYEEAFYSAVSEEIERMARVHV